MPEHKRQHYVPRCYLKPFSLDDAGAAINLYNIRRSQAVENASVKGQCAKDYLYGVDLEVERALQVIEGEYARILRLLKNPGEQPTEEDLNVLRGFAYLQYARTDMALRRIREVYEGMHNTMYEGRSVTPPDLVVSDREMMRNTMHVYLEHREYIEDLKICIVKNETQSDFITSDDPSIFTNRFYMQRLHRQDFGLVNSGVLFFLPLTTRLLLMCYDGRTYVIPDKRECYLSITRQADVFALNDLQYLKAAENIFFSRWDDRDRVEREFREVSPRRPDSWIQFSLFVPNGFTVEGERYRLATEEERRTARKTIIRGSTLHPVPSQWISKLKYRRHVRTYFDGSAAGHVRKKTWLKRRLPR